MKRKVLSLLLTLVLLVSLVPAMTIGAAADAGDTPTIAVWNIDDTPYRDTDAFCVGQTYTFTSYATTYEPYTNYDHSWVYTDGEAKNLTDGASVSWGDFAFTDYKESGWKVTFTPRTAGTYTITFPGSIDHAAQLSSCVPGDPNTTYGSITITVVDKVVSVYREDTAYSDAMYWYAGNTYNLSAYVYNASYEYTPTKWDCSAIDAEWESIDLSGAIITDTNAWGCNAVFTPAVPGTYTFKVQSADGSSTFKMLQFEVLPSAEFSLTFEGVLYGDTSVPLATDNASVSVSMVNGEHTDFTGTLSKSLAAGEYTYTVSADGYVTASGALSLTENKTVSVTLYAPAGLPALIRDSIAADFSASSDNYWEIIGLSALADARFPVSIQDRDETIAKAIDVFDGAGGAVTTAIYVITVSALGCDASQVVSDGEVYSAYDRLAQRFEHDIASGGWTEIYAFTLMALLQAGEDVRQAHADLLETCILELAPGKGGDWAAWGFSPDSAGIALAALCMARDKGCAVDESVIDVLVTDLKNALTANGTYAENFEHKENAESTAMAIFGLDAAGEDVSSLIAPEGTATLLEGLLSFAAEDHTGFKSNAAGLKAETATQQGLLALIAVLSEGATHLFDFEGKGTALTESPAHYLNCPVVFTLIPSAASVSVTKDGEPVENIGLSGRYDLPEGAYSYTVSAAGYTAKTNTLTVTAEDAENHVRKNISVSLSSAPGGGSGDNTITVTVHVKMHPAPAGGKVYTYKADKSAYYTIVSRAVTLESGSSVFDALDAALTAEGIEYEESTPGYIGMIGGITEGEYGPESGWLFMVGNTVITIGSRGHILTRNTTITWFYTDSFPDEYGSEQWVGETETKTPAASELAASGDGSAALTPAALADIEALGKGLTVNSKTGSVFIAPEGVQALSREAQDRGAEVAISITEASKDTSGFAVLGDDRVIAALNVSIKVGDSAVKSGFGTLSLSLSVGKAYAGKTLTILHLKSDGAYELLSGSVDKDGVLSFSVTSLSSFAVFPTAAAVPPQYIFSDVSAGDWFIDSVRYVYENGIMGGTTSDTFAPELLMSRAMLVTTLWRMEGSPAAPAPGFKDVADKNAWYYGAVAWAAEKGIVGGYGNGTFAPNDTLTREQLVTIFYRYAALKGYHTDYLADLSGYPDAKAVGAWAETAMGWAVANGIISGMDGRLAPAGGASRSQAAAIITRFAKNAPFTEAPEASAPAGEASARILSEAFDKTAAYFVSAGVPVFGGEWEIYALTKGGYDLPQGYLEGFYQNLCNKLKETDGVLSTRKYTEYSRTVFALTEAGYNPTDVAGFDLTAPLGDFEATLYQGINGPIWALIALDSGNFESDLRQDYLKTILDRELPGGGWTLSGKVPDADMTAMALTALVPYAKDAAVAAAMARGIAMLSELQNPNGGFSSGGTENCESCAQVLVALAALDIPLDDARFVKNGNTVLDGLLAYQLPDGAFAHLPGGAANYVASQQAIYALAYAK